MGKPKRKYKPLEGWWGGDKWEVERKASSSDAQNLASSDQTSQTEPDSPHPATVPEQEAAAVDSSGCKEGPLSSAAFHEQDAVGAGVGSSGRNDGLLSGSGITLQDAGQEEVSQQDKGKGRSSESIPLLTLLKSTSASGGTVYGISQQYSVKSSQSKVPNVMDSSWQPNTPVSAISSRNVTNKFVGSVKKSFNADSPSFTPSQPGQLKKTTFSSQAVNATEFTPKTSSTGTLMPPDTNNSVFNPAGMEFTPQSQQNYGFNQAIATNGAGAEGVGSYNPFNMSSMGAALGAPYNPYGDDHNPLAGPSSYNYSASSGYSLQPLQHHMYYPIGQPRPDLLPYQRQAHSFFMKEDLREDLQKKSEDVRLVVPNSNLPSVMDGLYHSLVALDTSRNTGHNTFGNTVSWVFKAMSQGTGIPVCLRRLQGFRVNNPQSLTPIEKWKRINNANVVSFLACFTSRDFGDSSLIFIHSYHPLAKTLSQYHFTSPKYSNHRYAPQPASRTQSQVPENVLWSYICQICNALKAIHGEGLAARCIDLTKVILTDKNRIRLAACGIHDVLDHEHLQQPRPMQDLQQEDFVQLGKLILSIGTSTVVNNNNMQMALEQFSRSYSNELRQRVMWLLSPSPKKVDELAREISGHILDSFDASYHASDDLYSELHKEVENGRVARLMMKLGCINERPEYENDVNWAETGERYQLKLFRDYVFHQVDSNGHPVIDLGHILGCLNKLDCGIDDKVYLTSRDNQSLFVVSYKELKKQLLNAFDDLRKAGKQSQPTPPRGY